MKLLPKIISALTVLSLVACGESKDNRPMIQPGTYYGPASECEKIVEFNAEQTAKCKSLGLPDKSVLACNQITHLDGKGKLQCLSIIRASGAEPELVSLCSEMSYSQDADNKRVWLADVFNPCVGQAATRNATVIKGCISKMPTNGLKATCIGAVSTTFNEEQFKFCNHGISKCTKYSAPWHDKYECYHDVEIMPTPSQVVQCVAADKPKGAIEKCITENSDPKLSDYSSTYTQNEGNDSNARAALSACITKK